MRPGSALIRDWPKPTSPNSSCTDQSMVLALISSASSKTIVGGSPARQLGAISRMTSQAIDPTQNRKMATTTRRDGIFAFGSLVPADEFLRKFQLVPKL